MEQGQGPSFGDYRINKYLILYTEEAMHGNSVAFNLSVTTGLTNIPFQHKRTEACSPCGRVTQG